MRRVLLSAADERRIRQLIKRAGHRSSSAWTAIAALAGVRASDLFEIVQDQKTGEVTVWARSPGDLVSRN